MQQALLTRHSGKEGLLIYFSTRQNNHRGRSVPDNTFPRLFFRFCPLPLPLVRLTVRRSSMLSIMFYLLVCYLGPHHRLRPNRGQIASRRQRKDKHHRYPSSNIFFHSLLLSLLFRLNHPIIMVSSRSRPTSMNRPAIYYIIALYPFPLKNKRKRRTPKRPPEKAPY